MSKSISKHIKEHVPAKSSIVLAFSGGPDSVYLFHKLKEAQKVHPFTIILAHFNHKLRGKDSNRDEKFCKKFAKKNKIVIETGEKNIAAEKGNTEDVARKYRYKFLKEVRKRFDAKVIITAHHLDDNIETFLMNFLRGSGVKGLSCMQFKSDDLLRPMLEISKEEIIGYLKENSIKFRTDKSNFDESYTRNNIRKNVVPLLKKIQPSLNNVFLRNWKTLSGTQEFLDLEAHNWITKNVKELYEIPLKKFGQLESFIQIGVLRSLFNSYHKSTYNLSKITLTRAQKIINEKKTGKKVPFGPKTILTVTSSSFEITSKTKPKKIARKKLPIPGETKFTHGKISSKIVNKIPKNLSKGVYFDYSKCQFPLYVRGKKDGDAFKNIGMKGSQKLQDFFVNNKISSLKRNKVPLVVDKNDKIIAIGSYAISDAHKITKQTEKIVSLSFKPSLEN